MVKNEEIQATLEGVLVARFSHLIGTRISTGALRRIIRETEKRVREEIKKELKKYVQGGLKKIKQKNASVEEMLCAAQLMDTEDKIDEVCKT